MITSVVLGAIIYLVDDADRTDELAGWILRIWMVTGIWFLGWPVWVSIAHWLKPGDEPAET